jgi:hypothetical protein
MIDSSNMKGLTATSMTSFELEMVEIRIFEKKIVGGQVYWSGYLHSQLRKVIKSTE